MDPKDVPICSDFALLFYEQKKQRKLVKYCSVIGYLLGNPLGTCREEPVERLFIGCVYFMQGMSSLYPYK